MGIDSTNSLKFMDQGSCFFAENGSYGIMFPTRRRKTPALARSVSRMGFDNEALNRKTIRKVIVVPGRLVNIAVS